MSKIINFVTGSKRKVEELDDQLKEHGYTVIQKNCDLDEIQSLDVNEVVKAKLDSAIEKYPNQNLLVDDRGFYINELNGYPGALVKSFLKSISIDQILKIMTDAEDRSAEFRTVLGYFDGKEKHFFEEIEKGFITKEKRNGNIRGWTDLLYIYGYQDDKTKALCEYTDTEWSNYLSKLTKSSASLQLANFLNEKHYYANSH